MTLKITLLIITQNLFSTFLVRMLIITKFTNSRFLRFNDSIVHLTKTNKVIINQLSHVGSEDKSNG